MNIKQNTKQLSQITARVATLKQNLKDSQIQSGQALQTCHNKSIDHGFTRIDTILAGEFFLRCNKLGTSDAEGGEL